VATVTTEAAALAHGAWRRGPRAHLWSTAGRRGRRGASPQRRPRLGRRARSRPPRSSTARCGSMARSRPPRPSAARRGTGLLATCVLIGHLSGSARAARGCWGTSGGEWRVLACYGRRIGASWHCWLRREE
jgi:hypothetical protein